MPGPRRVLVTCPPMRHSIHRYGELFEKHNFQVDAPDIVQTMSEQELIEVLPAYDGWVIGDDPATANVFRHGVEGRLRGAVKWGVGVDNVDFHGAEAAGLQVTNTPGMFGREVADVAYSYLVGLARGLFEIDAGVKDNRWPKPVGISLCDKTCALVGMGDIGFEIAKRLLVCDMKVNVYDPAKPDLSSLAGTIRHLDWPEAIDESDFVVLCCSLNENTRNLIGGEFFRQCKNGLRLVNVSRGPLVDEMALADAIESGVVHSAALEVFDTEPLPADSPLRRFPQLIFGSHNGSNTQEAVDRTSHTAVEKLANQLDRKSAT
ncbi:MAG: phosphoglycerate dehydrogenase [Planctomycetota bacterium]